jgi:hypothetical protein
MTHGTSTITQAVLYSSPQTRHGGTRTEKQNRVELRMKSKCPGITHVLFVELAEASFTGSTSLSRKFQQLPQAQIALGINMEI